MKTSWGDFLEMRKRVIHEMLAEGRHPNEIARTLSMVQHDARGALSLDGDQVRLIGMTPLRSEV